MKTLNTALDGGRAATTLVRLSDRGGTPNGRIEKLLDAGPACRTQTWTRVE